MDTTGVRRKPGLRRPLLRWRAAEALCTSADSLSSTVNCSARPLRKRFARRTVNRGPSLRTPSVRLRTAQSDRLRPMFSRPDWHAMPPNRMRCRILRPPPRRRPRRRQWLYAQRRRLGARSCAWWDSLQDLYTIHIYAIPTTARASNGQMATSRNCSGRRRAPRDPSQSRLRREEQSSFSRHIVIDARGRRGGIHRHRRVGEDAGGSVERIGRQWLPLI